MENDTEMRGRAEKVIRALEIAHSPDSTFAKCARDVLQLLEEREKIEKQLADLRKWTEEMMRSAAEESTKTKKDDSTFHAAISAAFAAVLGRIDGK